MSPVAAITSKSVKEMSDHVIALGRAFNVRIGVDKRLQPHDAAAGRNWAGQSIIRIHPVIDECTYVVALHELGHRVAPMGDLTHEMSPFMQMMGTPENLRDVRLRLDEEIAAWKWARHYALEWTQLAVQLRRDAFNTYRLWAMRYGVTL